MRYCEYFDISTSFWREIAKNRISARVIRHFAPRYRSAPTPGLIPCSPSQQAARLLVCGRRLTSARAIVTMFAVIIPQPTQRLIPSSP
jgi:hypothetical protein